MSDPLSDSGGLGANNLQELPDCNAAEDEPQRRRLPAFRGLEFFREK
jgi:hypothetical protein